MATLTRLKKIIKTIVDGDKEQLRISIFLQIVNHNLIIKNQTQSQKNSTRVTRLDRPLFISCLQFGGKFGYIQINLLREAACPPHVVCLKQFFGEVGGSRHIAVRNRTATINRRLNPLHVNYL